MDAIIQSTERPRGSREGRRFVTIYKSELRRGARSTRAVLDPSFPTPAPRLYQLWQATRPSQSGVLICFSLAVLVHAAFGLGMAMWMLHRAPASISQVPGRSTADDLVFVDLDPEEATPSEPQEIARDQEPVALPVMEPVAPQVERSPEVARVELDPPMPAKPARTPATQRRAKAAAVENKTAGLQESTRRTTTGSTRPRSGASVLSGPDPLFPAAAIAASFQGAARLRVWVGRDGRVVRVELAGTSGRADCDQSARDRVLQTWRFRPATIDGQPVESELVVHVKFTLDS